MVVVGRQPEHGSVSPGFKAGQPSPFLAEVPCGANTTTAISNNAASYFGAGTAAEPDAPPRLGKLPLSDCLLEGARH